MNPSTAEARRFENIVAQQQGQATPYQNTSDVNNSTAGNQGYTAPYLSDSDRLFESSGYKEAAQSTIPTEQDAYSEQLRIRQGEIDAANKTYNVLLNQTRQQNLERTGSTGARQARAGLLGSERGAAIDTQTDVFNQDQVNSVEAQRVAAVSSVMGKAKSDAAQMIRDKQAAKKLGYDAYMENIGQRKQVVTTAVNNLVQRMLQDGTPMTTESADNLAKIYGSDKDTIISAYSVAKSANDKLKLDAEKTRSEITKNLTPNIPASAEEYNFAKLNGYTGTYMQYQDADANRKALASQTIGANNLTPVQTGNFLRISSDFQKDSIMKAASKSGVVMATADRVIADPANAAKQLTGLYTLVKVLDPDSAVREGELDLAQQTQSYFAKFQTTFEKINSGKILDTNTTVQLAQETKELAQSWADAGMLRENQYKSQAQVAGIGNAFGEYLGGYQRPYAEQGSPQSGKTWTPEKQSLFEQNGFSPEEIEEYKKNEGFISVGGDTNRASNLATAIKTVESGGNYNAVGDAGTSKGAYQFQPASWSGWSKQYLGISNAPMTPQNQDKVAVARIQDLLDQGYDEQQIALIWNGGEPVVKKGFNKKIGLAYDSGAYANKVLKQLKA